MIRQYFWFIQRVWSPDNGRSSFHAVLLSVDNVFASTLVTPVVFPGTHLLISVSIFAVAAVIVHHVSYIKGVRASPLVLCVLSSFFQYLLFSFPLYTRPPKYVSIVEVVCYKGRDNPAKYQDEDNHSINLAKSSLKTMLSGISLPHSKNISAICCAV